MQRHFGSSSVSGPVLSIGADIPRIVPIPYLRHQK